MLGCDDSGNLSWTDTDFSDDSTAIALELDSTGRDLWVVAKCGNVETLEEGRQGARRWPEQLRTGSLKNVHLTGAVGRGETAPPAPVSHL